jgi:hypothetical protein
MRRTEKKGGYTMKTIKEIKQAIEQKKTRSAWDNGVKEYALELLEKFEEGLEYTELQNLQLPDDAPETVFNLNEENLLNGAKNWKEYSWGGCSSIYDWDIANRLCSPSELVKTHNGERKPNSGEEWLDTQARALYQAALLILKTAE